MFTFKAKHAVLIIAIPFIFQVLESVNGPWPIPFKWPEVSSDLFEFDTRKRQFVEPNISTGDHWDMQQSFYHSSICQYARDCVPKSVKFPMKIAVAPSIGLSVCIVGGTLSAELEALVCYLERMSAIKDLNKLSVSQIETFCGATNKFHSITEMSRNIRVRIRDMNRWAFVMVMKDPIDRFITGFIKHCIVKGDSCYNCGNDPVCFADVYHIRLQQFAMYNEENYRSISEIDWDLFPQTWMCDVEQWREKYRILPYSSNVEQVVSNFTEFLGYKHFAAVDRIFRSSRWHEQWDYGLELELRKTIARNWQLRHLIEKMYHNDFKILNS